MSWNDITITDAGSTLLADMINGGKLTITRIAIGSETVSAAELHLQTNISEPINAPALLAGKSLTEDGNGTVLKIQIRNDGVVKSVRMRQIGIFAETDGAEEVLLAILQDEIGEEIPAYSEFPQFELNQWITLGISRTNNIAVSIAPQVYASAKDVEDIKNRLDDGSVGASTLNGKTADDFAEKDHTHTAGQISGLPESLPASGGDSDTVDGKHASDFAEAKHTHAASEISGLPTSLPANGGSADSATKATQDSAGQQINTTYIKALSVSGKTITYTKGNGTTGTLNTQDTTYANMKAATASAAGAAGLVPAPAAGAQAKYLRGDGTWQTPPDTNTTYGDASASASGLVNTGAQTFGGNKTFNGQILPNGATAYGTPQARKLASGTAAATTTNCPSGAWYGQHS